jgi:hypothetical protein
MIELLLAAAALAPAYTARTEENRRLTVTVRDRRVTRVRGTVVDYECDPFGNIGPVRFNVRVKARIDRRGRFSFVHGDRAQRVGVAGYLKGDTAHGRIRMAGTIATGQRCESAVLRWR